MKSNVYTSDQRWSRKNYKQALSRKWKGSIDFHWHASFVFFTLVLDFHIITIQNLVCVFVQK